MADEPADRRIRKTERLLQDALAALVRQKPYDAIAVKEILDRADVGRSTFYEHFRNKDDLLASVIRGMLAADARRPGTGAKGAEELLGFSLPLLERLDHHRAGDGRRMEARSRAVLHRNLRKVLAGRIAEELRRRGVRSTAARSVPPGLLAAHLASTFVFVLNWWIDSGSRLPPKDVDTVFRELVLPVIAASRG